MTQRSNSTNSGLKTQHYKLQRGSVCCDCSGFNYAVFVLFVLSTSVRQNIMSWGFWKLVYLSENGLLYLLGFFCLLCHIIWSWVRADLPRRFLKYLRGVSRKEYEGDWLSKHSRHTFDLIAYTKDSATLSLRKWVGVIPEALSMH